MLLVSDGHDQDGLSREKRRKEIDDVWLSIYNGEESGATDWTTLDEMQRQVTEALYGTMSDLNLAESLTAHALLLICGTI